MFETMEKLTIKRLPDGSAIVEGYGVLFDVQDLEGDTFNKATDFGLDRVVGAPVYFDHSLDDVVQKDGATYVLKGIEYPIGKIIEVTPDNVGLYMRLKLEKAAEYWEFVESAMTKNIGFSTGSSPHLVRKDENNIVKRWPIAEVSLTLTPAEHRTVKHFMRVKTIVVNGEAEEVTSDNSVSLPANNVSDDTNLEQEVKMDNEKLDKILGLVSGLAERQDAIESEVKAAKAKQVDPVVNDPGAAVKNVNVIYGMEEGAKFDHIETENLALAYETVNSFQGVSRNARPASDALARQLVKRYDSQELTRTPDGRQYSNAAKSFLQRIGGATKANEINQSTLANYGDEWVGVYYSGRLWEKIRTQAVVLAELERAGSVFEAPAGAESIVFPLESTDPIWYKVAQSASLTSNPGGIPTNTVTSSNLGTANKTMTLSKLGARVLWTGELMEDAVLMYVNQLRAQIEKSGAEYLDSALIDGDTETGATTNINDIAGTPAATDWFLVWNGLRKIPLVTNTANSRNGGALTIEDYILTAQMLGTSGINAIDRSKVAFLVDPTTHYKTLQLAEVKTLDVFAAPTIEGGQVTSIWGYRNIIAGQMAKAGGTGLTNSAGKVDVDTLGNNTLGQIIAFRPDQWSFGWRRRMTMETTRFAAADATEIVVQMRAGFVNRDTEASAITYNLTV